VASRQTAMTPRPLRAAFVCRASRKAEYRRTTEDAEPVTLEAVEAGHVIAALGMAVKLAVEHVEENWTASLGLITHAVDAIVRLGAQLRTITPLGQVEFGGHELVLARGILVGAIKRLRTRQWRCSCGPHLAGAASGLIASLDRDLRQIGGWAPPFAQPASAGPDCCRLPYRLRPGQLVSRNRPSGDQITT
jgi:hypothetical protein